MWLWASSMSLFTRFKDKCDQTDQDYFLLVPSSITHTPQWMDSNCFEFISFACSQTIHCFSPDTDINRLHTQMGVRQNEKAGL